jgi:uncharacterized protein
MSGARCCAFTEEAERMKAPGSEGEHDAQRQFGTTRRAMSFYNQQMLDYLNPLMREFIAHQELAFIGTADASGACDCSFRAGPPGFVHVIDEKTLALPDYHGNGVMASIGNILEDPHVGLVFIDFFRSTVGLHVNGTARIVDNDTLSAQTYVTPELLDVIQTTGGRHPERWVIVEVEEAYIHCSKHVPLLQKLDKEMHWGTDDENCKGGDVFKSKCCPRPW